MAVQLTSGANRHPLTCTSEEEYLSIQNCGAIPDVQTYAARLPPSAPPQASFILHPCKLPPRTFYYCIRNLLVHNPSQHLPGPGSLCLTPRQFSTLQDVWIPWLTPSRSAFGVAKHPSMPKLHFSPHTLAFDHVSVVSQTVPVVYLTSPTDRMAPCTTMLYRDLEHRLDDL